MFTQISSLFSSKTDKKRELICRDFSQIQKIKGIQMTKEQQELVEKNYGLLFAFMKKHHINEEEYYDLLAIELCNAAINYKPESGSSFAVIAYTYMLNGYRNEYNKQRNSRHRPEGGICSVDQESSISDSEHGTTLEDVYFQDKRDYYKDVEIRLDIEQMYDSLSKKQKSVYELLISGYSQIEIADMLNCSRQNISQLTSQIRQKLS